MLRPGSLLFVLSMLFAASAARAQTVQCGMDCSTSTYMSCNDSVSLTGATAASLNCSASAGSCSGETFCATLGHQLPSSAFPLDITEILLVAASSSPMNAGMPFELTVYEETGSGAPGSQIGASYSLNIQGSQSAASRIDLTSGGLSPITVPNAGAFRVCLRKGFDAGHNVCLDANGTSAPARNWAYVSVAASSTNPCGTQIIPPAWYQADGTNSPLPGFPGLTGDFIIRARVNPASLTGVPGAADCAGGGDAGVSGDAGLDAGSPIDTGTAADTGVIVEDLGPADQGAPPSPDASADPDTGSADSGLETDAGDLQDVGVSIDAGIEEDAGVSNSDAGPVAAPTILSMTPRSALVGTSIEVLIAGTGFVEGATASLGQIALLSPAVSGSTTLRATVPAGIAAGTHDLVVTNPDGQAAILVDAFEVNSNAEAEPEVKEGCRCAAPTRSGSGMGALFALSLTGLLRRRRERS